MTNSFKDYFSGHSRRYQQFRPSYPDELFDFLASLAPGHSLAWDCATGNGQAAISLAKYFKQVIATDASEKQIERATPNPKVIYQLAKAEHAPLNENSVDLICVAQALHWFDIAAFYREAQRVLTDKGVMAIWSYRFLSISPELDNAIYYLYKDILDPYWPVERKLVDEGYAHVDFPFHTVSAPSFKMTAEWDLSQVLGYLSTWSAVERYKIENGNDPLLIVKDSLCALWGDTKTVKQVQWPLTMKVGLHQ
ncbi:class I SAM-dependent methyltransferase [Kaarinaea lacus]